MVDFRQTRPPYNRCCRHCYVWVVFCKSLQDSGPAIFTSVVALIKPDKSDNVTVPKSNFWVFTLWRWHYVTFTLKD